MYEYIHTVFRKYWENKIQTLRFSIKICELLRMVQMYGCNTNEIQREKSLVTQKANFFSTETEEINLTEGERKRKAESVSKRCWSVRDCGLQLIYSRLLSV